MENIAAALADLATGQIAQLRLSGVILSLLRQKGILTLEQALGAIDEGAARLPDSHPLLPVFAGLKNEFRE